MDHWLLGSDLSTYLEPYRFARLNAVEKILMARKQKDGGSAMARYVRELKEMILPNPEEYNRLFDAAIGSSALETDDALGLKAQQEQQRTDLVKSMSKKSIMALKEMEGASFGKSFNQIGGVGGGGTADRALSLDFRATANAEADLGVRDEAKAVGEIERFDSSLNRIMKGQEKLLMKRSREAQTTAEAIIEAKGKRATNGTLRARLEERQAVRQFYRKLPQTEEWAENNYYQLPIDQQNANLILINAFWNDFASHPEGEPFVSGNFIYATRNFSEMMFALSVLDLPFEPVDHEVENKGAPFPQVGPALAPLSSGNSRGQECQGCP